MKDIMEIIDDLEKEKNELKDEILQLRKELEDKNKMFDYQSNRILTFIRSNPNVSYDFEATGAKLYGPSGCKEMITNIKHYLMSDYTGNKLEVSYG